MVSTDVDVTCNFSFSSFLLPKPTVPLSTVETSLSFDSSDTDEQEYLANSQLDKDEHSLCIYYILKAQVMYLYEEYELAEQYLTIAEEKEVYQKM